MDNVTDTAFLTLDNVTVDSTTLRPSRTLHPRLQEMFHEAVGSCMATLGQFPPLETGMSLYMYYSASQK